MKLTRLSLLAASMAAVLTGCSNRNDQTSLTATVPVDRPCMVITTDIDRLFGDFDMKLTESTIELPDYLVWTREMVRPQTLADAADVLGAVDRSKVVFYMESANYNNSFLAVDLTDTQAFGEAVGRIAKDNASQTGGFEVTPLDGMSVMVRGNRAWLTRIIPDSLNAILNRARQLNLDQARGVSDVLGNSDGGFMHMAMLSNPGTDPDGQTGEWNVGMLRIDGRYLAATGSTMLGDGKPVTNEWLDRIDTDFLRYVPDGMNAVVAIGRNEKPVTAGEVADRLNRILPESYNSRQLVAMIAPYIAALNGTSALALKYDFQTNDMGFVIMAHMKQDDVNNIISQLSQMAAGLGIATSTDPRSGTVTADLSAAFGTPMHVTVKNADGYLLITTYDASGRYNNQYNTTFEGKNAAAWVSLPLTALDYGEGPVGLHMQAQAQNDASKLRVEFAGSPYGFAETLSRLIAHLYGVSVAD